MLAQQTISPFKSHPNAAFFDRFFAQPLPPDFKSTGLARKDYLPLIAGNVDYFKQYQRDDGIIIDPDRMRETQYATPAFAVAAGILVKESGRKDLLDSATKALSSSISELVNHRTADNHSDFYIPLIMHAYAFLKDQVAPATRETWDKQLRSVDPDKMYHAELREMNWNIVSDDGELLRRQAGLVPLDASTTQLDYLEKCLDGQVKHFTPFGMYQDPNSPLAYDAFARLWLEDMIAGAPPGSAAYQGKRAAQIRDFLKTGGLSTLLLLSPSGEWASGGRSAFHNWNEAAIAAICEAQANTWNAQGRADVAGAFKRAAHTALQSVMRWQRPSCDLWIVKNRMPLAKRFGFESYSYVSQYNLLPMAMLAMAYQWSDDKIAERPMPSQSGSYVFDLRETFHKIAAASGGNYVLIDTAADPHYNATGLQRIHTTGVLFPPLSDSTAAERAYTPADAPKIAMTPGLLWKSGASGDWRSLADFSEATGADNKPHVAEAKLTPGEVTGQKVSFEIDYALAGGGEDGRHVIERYTLSAGEVEFATEIKGGPAITALRARIPVLQSDGGEPPPVVKDGVDSLTATDRGSTIQWTMVAPREKPIPADGPSAPSHNGMVIGITGDLPGKTTGEVRWTIRQWQQK